MEIERDEETFDTALQAIRREWFNELKEHLEIHYFDIEEGEKEEHLNQIINHFPFIPSKRDESIALIKGNNNYNDDLIDALLDNMYM